MSDMLPPGEEEPEDISQYLGEDDLPLFVHPNVIAAMPIGAIKAELRRMGLDPDCPLDPRITQMLGAGETDDWESDHNIEDQHISDFDISNRDNGLIEEPLAEFYIFPRSDREKHFAGLYIKAIRAE